MAEGRKNSVSKGGIIVGLIVAVGMISAFIARLVSGIRAAIAGASSLLELIFFIPFMTSGNGYNDDYYDYEYDYEYEERYPSENDYNPTVDYEKFLSCVNVIASNQYKKSTSSENFTIEEMISFDIDNGDGTFALKVNDNGNKKIAVMQISSPEVNMPRYMNYIISFCNTYGNNMHTVFKVYDPVSESTITKKVFNDVVPSEFGSCIGTFEVYESGEPEEYYYSATLRDYNSYNLGYLTTVNSYYNVSDVTHSKMEPYCVDNRKDTKNSLCSQILDADYNHNGNEYTLLIRESK